MQPKFLSQVPHDDLGSDLRRYRAQPRLRDYFTVRDLVWSVACAALCLILVLR